MKTDRSSRLRRFGLLLVVLAIGGTVAALVVPGARGGAIVPTSLVYQGKLTGADGKPIEGVFEMRFRLYETEKPDVGTQPVCSWTQANVAVKGGIFRADLGNTKVGDGTCTDMQEELATHSQLWMEVSLRQKPEDPFDVMTPLLRLGATARAHHAQFCEWAATAENLAGKYYTMEEVDALLLQKLGGYYDKAAMDDLLAKKAAVDHKHDEFVPPGAVMFFNLPECPAGWQPVSAARGRTVVGMPLNGTLGGTTGAPLTDLGVRSIADVPAHLHAVAPPQVATLEDGMHMHAVDGPKFNSDTAGDHAHLADPPVTASAAVAGHIHSADPQAVDTSSTGSHQHSVNPPNTATTAIGDHAHSADPPSTTSSNTGSHTHAYDDLFFAEYNGSIAVPGNVGSGDTDNDNKGFQMGRTTGSAGSHTHTVDILAFNSSGAGGHSHTVDIAAFNADANGAHTHSVNVGAFTTTAAGDHPHNVDVQPFNTASAGPHQHSADPPAFNSSAGGSHTHPVKIPQFDSGVTGNPSVDVTMPYVQFLACQKM